MWKKLKEFYKTHKKTCAMFIIAVASFVCYCFGSELPVEEALTKLCSIIGC